MTVDVSADLEMNLAAETAAPPPNVPALGAGGLVVLAGLLLAAGRAALHSGGRCRSSSPRS